MICITTFLEDIDHEMQDYTTIVISKKAYKVDGDSGIKTKCENSELKSVDYFGCNSPDEFQYVEFSDLLAQDEQIKQKIKDVKKVKILPSKLNLEIRKDYFKIIHQELVQKLKDSKIIRDEMPTYIKNIPENFQSTGKFLIVIAPIKEGKGVEAARVIDYWATSIKQSLPKKWLTGIEFIPLDIFVSM
ncbi:hypothetical protein [Acinetobacter wuhouensis]|uniref:Uncharacterized protein n=1 Tax=Acinetobacter wuhouensis TaxID=1879050 RepID=A0A3G2T326_9GAMM|nr:hypothetical protein [Acinetobacter wuhouensis]AYO54372.1 hypothetical protein CDG68_12310 [Acinetobacter wuhouensis]